MDTLIYADMSSTQAKAVADWLADRGERLYVVPRPVRIAGPVACYWVYPQWRGDIIVHRHSALIAPRVRWVGSSRPNLGEG
jgi:hypothetical protein